MSYDDEVPETADNANLRRARGRLAVIRRDYPDHAAEIARLEAAVSDLEGKASQ